MHSLLNVKLLEAIVCAVSLDAQVDFSLRLRRVALRNVQSLRAALFWNPVNTDMGDWCKELLSLLTHQRLPETFVGGIVAQLLLVLLVGHRRVLFLLHLLLRHVHEVPCHTA